MSQISSSAPVASVRSTSRASFVLAPLAAGVPAVLLLALALGTGRQPYDPAASSSSLFSLSSAASEPKLVTRDDSPYISTPETAGALRAMAMRGEWPRVQTALAAGGAAWTAPLMALPPVRGRAPMDGQVSRVSVRVGQSVSVNDAILELSSGPDSRVARADSRVERRQSAAEREQVEAANRQAQLQHKMRLAQTQLEAAQERVAAAQQRVEQARGIVARLQRGEAVSVPATKKPRVARRENRAQEAAMQAASELETQSRAAQKEAVAAKHQFEILSSRLGAAQNAVQSAQAAVVAAQKRFDDKEIKAAELDAARAAQEEAEANAKSVASDLAAARKAVASTQALADVAKSKDKNAVKVGDARSLRDMTVFGDDQGSAPETSSETSASAMSVGDAARMARSAMAESAAAVAEARRIKKRVDLYAGQVNATRTDITTSSRALASAQNEVLDQTIQANLSSVRAPASGVVESVANVADSVNAGDTIVTIGRAGLLRATWTDATGAWRALREDQTVPIQIVAPDGTAHAASARINEIDAPSGAAHSGAATIEAVVYNPRTGAGRIAQSGWQARLMIAPKAGATLARLPSEAIVGENLSAGTLARVAVLAPVAGEAGTARLEWRQVRLQAGVKGAASGWTVSGVRVGERVALHANALRDTARVRLIG